MITAKLNNSLMMIILVLFVCPYCVSWCQASQDAGVCISSLTLTDDSSLLFGEEQLSSQIVSLAHDAPVPIYVYMKRPDTGWEKICSSDPIFDGHNVKIPISKDINHAWLRVVADYSTVIDNIDKIDAAQSASLVPGTVAFDEVVELAGYEYVDDGDGSAVLLKTDIPFESMQDATTANNHASATPDPGIINIMWLNENDARFAVWLLSTNGVRKSSGLSDATAPGGWQVVGSGDINQDGITDIMWYRPSDGAMAYWFMEADGYRKASGSMGATAPGGWQVVATGEIDQDGTVDLMWYRPTDGKMAYWLLNSDGTRKSAGDMGATAPGGWQVVGVGDIDQDGTDDLMWNRPTDGKMAYWMLNTDGTRKSAGDMGATAPGGWQVVGAGDLDLDGTVDLMWNRPTDGKMAYWMLNSDGTRKSAGDMGATAPGGWEVVGTGDIDGSGTTDLMWYRPSDAMMAYWLMGTNGTRSASGSMGASAPGGWNVVATGNI